MSKRLLVLILVLLVSSVLLYQALQKKATREVHSSALVASSELKNGFSAKDGHSIPLEKIFSGGPPKDGIPAINQPKFISASDANWLNPEDIIVGLKIRQVSKAYPLRVLVWHEIVNDIIDGDNIAVTYCPLCGSAIIFKAASGTTFGVSGLLYQSDVLMYDHQTDSLWSQLKFEAVVGKRTGEKLEVLPSQLVTWKEWLKLYPETQVLSKETGYKRDYALTPYEGYKQATNLMFPVDREDNRFHPKQEVFVVLSGELAKAYPLNIFSDIDSLDDELNKQKIRIEVADGRPLAAYAGEEQLKTFNAFWFAWYAFRPDTLVYSVSN